MNLALSIFGVSYKGGPATFCYAYFRNLRGPGAYPAPNIPKGKRTNGISRVPVGKFEDFELVCWDKIFDVAEADTVLAELASGQMPSLEPCPIEGVQALGGVICKKIIVQEGRDWVRSSGTGMLWCESLVFDGAVESVADFLSQSVGAGVAPSALKDLLDCIGKESGLGDIFRKEPRLGLADRFFRAEEGDAYGPLLELRPDKPDFQSRDPMRRCMLGRRFAALDRPFMVHVTVANFDAVLKDYIVKLPPGESELVIKVEAHLTDVNVEAFNPDGTLAQRLRCGFTQGIQFGLSAGGRSDVLPKVKGAPDAADLQKRPRIATSAFSGPSVGKRSGGFDVIRDNSERIAALIGGKKWQPETLWFDRSGDGQLEAIRWIKGQMEKPETKRAFFVDPFLGTEALKRVIARQGNENIKLKILISPARVDPDADELDVEVTEDHCKKLVDAANEWADKLCGDIEIFEIRRGENKRQAFHDRYLVVVDANDIPKAYLLSNSLNKAAGDWAFAISELDRITSYRVSAYVEGLLHGKDGDRDLEAKSIWKSAPVDVYAPLVEHEALADQAAWVAKAVAFIEKLRNAAAQHSADDKIEAVCEEYLAAWPQGTDPDVLAENIYQQLNYRESYVVRVSVAFAAAQQLDVSDKLDERLLKGFLKNLPRGAKDRPNCSWIYTGDRDVIVGRLALAIEKGGNPTNFVLGQINPIVDSMIQAIENQRAESGIIFELLQIVTTLLNLGLEVAKNSNSAVRFRQGLAADYICWVGRLMRSEAANGRCDVRRDGWTDEWSNDLKFCAGQIAGVANLEVEKAVSLLIEDPLVCQDFKDFIHAHSQEVLS